VDLTIQGCSIKHGYETWEKEKTKLTTCNPTDKQPVNDHQNRQEVAANEEIVFSYDIKFEVLPFTSLIMLSASFQRGTRTQSQLLPE
jgi:hypothetical protein